jgi:hypothetical protein
LSDPESRIAACLLFVLLIPSISIAGPQHRTLQPVDEAATNPDFLAFRTRLQTIIAKRDSAALLEIVHPEIRASFGSHYGIEAFKELWNLNVPGTELWEELGAVLALGGTFDRAGDFTAPYTFSRWPDSVDAFEFVAVIGTNVRVRTEPIADAPVLTSVSYAILQTDHGPGAADSTPEGWTAVKFDGRRGYIASRFVRSPIDYRARFSYTDGRWRMTLFLAGD